jgi:hypothetical protein
MDDLVPIRRQEVDGFFGRIENFIRIEDMRIRGSRIQDPVPDA